MGGDIQLVAPDVASQSIVATPDILSRLDIDQPPVKYIPVEQILSESEKQSRMKGVVLFASPKNGTGQIASLTCGFLFVHQSNVIGGGMLKAGQMCYFNLDFNYRLEQEAKLVVLNEVVSTATKIEFQQ